MLSEARSSMRSRRCRARVVEDSVVSISGQSLKTLDISDPDNPALLADLILAWPVDYIHRVGEIWYKSSVGKIITEPTALGAIPAQSCKCLPLRIPMKVLRHLISLKE